MNKEYADYLNSKEWKEIRERRIRIDGGKCALCGSTKNLHVHHKTYSSGAGMDGLITVCQKCHNDIHDFHDAVAQSSRNGKLRECIGAYNEAMAEIMDRFVCARESTLGGDSNLLFENNRTSKRMNAYIDALLNWNPYSENVGYGMSQSCGIGYKRYNEMRLKKKRGER